MKLVLNEKGKKQLEDPKTGPQARAFVDQFQKNMAKTLKTLKLTFKVDHTMTVDSGNPNLAKTGTWSLQGRAVRVIMTDAGQKTPQMEITPDGKRIHTVYSDPNFGAGKVDLVRVK